VTPWAGDPKAAAATVPAAPSLGGFGDAKAEGRRFGRRPPRRALAGQPKSRNAPAAAATSAAQMAAPSSSVLR